MQQQKTWMIFLANVLWALLPIAVVELFQTYSVFLIFLLRFFFGGAFILVTGIILTLFYKRNHPEINLKILGKYLRSQNPDYRHLHQFGYFAIVGSIGFTIHISFFFFSIKFLGILVTVIGFPISLILVSIFSKETMDMFKGLYLGVLIIAIILIGAGRIQLAEANLQDPTGWLALLLFTVSLTVLMNQMAKDPLQRWETQLVIQTHGVYKILRMLTKIGFIFLIAAAFIFPLTGILLLLPADSLFQQEAVKFYAQLGSLGTLFLTWQGLFLILGATVTCYLLLFAAEAYWPRSALPFDTWSSLLSIVEPAGSVIFGVLIVNEQFPIDYLFIVVFLLSLSILLRYVHETSNKVIAYVALSLVPQREKQVFQDLYHVKGIQSMASVVGDYDLILFIQSSSIVAFNKLVRRKLESHPDVEKVKVFLVEEVLK